MRVLLGGEGELLLGVEEYGLVVNGMYDRALGELGEGEEWWLLTWAGTYQQYITSLARYTSRIPDGVSDQIAGPLMYSASTMHNFLLD